MNKIFHFDSSPEPYAAAAAVLCCFDQRIRLATNKFLQRHGILRPDMIVVAGGAKTLASPRNDFEREFILEQVRMSVRLHHTKQVFLMSVGPALWSGQSGKELVLAESFLHPDTEREATEVGRFGSGVWLERRSLAWLQVPCAEQWLTVGQAN